MNHPSIHWTDDLSGLFSPFAEQMVKYSKIYLLIDEQVSQIWLNDLLEQCPEISQANVLEIPSGEEGKDWDILKHVLDQWVEDAADRQTLVINIGGGATTDLGGFAASIFKRGLDFYHVPTTLMAMVDASLGGKNGINFHGVKNVLGTFEAPNELIVCPLFLSSLPDEALLSGMAEMLKHGLIQDQALWEALIDLDDISAETLTPFIQRNIQIKLKIVEQDPFELGERKLLNFGHTIGHALESYSMLNQISVTHGQCVAWGMVFSCLTSQSDRLLEADTAEEIIENLLDLYPLPQHLPDWKDIQSFLIQDKKNQDGLLQFTLIKSIGRGVIKQSKTMDDVEPIWDTFRSLK
ncbi:MAG: 3-dehydroquinate synthase [Bacteroidota bacterium]|jgi:3-dehydroquinate synthase